MTSLAFERLRWHHPEWFAAALAACAWVVVLAAPDESGAVEVHHAHSHHHHGAGGAEVAWTGAVSGWLLMSAAMMVPASLPAVRRIALGGMWCRRQRSATLFLVSYLAVWATFGAAALLSVTVVQRVFHASTETLLGGVLIVAAAWELTRWKRRSLRACHVIRPLPPRGWKADAACMRAGMRYGQQCVIGCWALMLAMAVAGHSLVALAVLLASVVAAQRLLVGGTRLGPPVAIALVAAAIVVVIA